MFHKKKGKDGLGRDSAYWICLGYINGSGFIFLYISSLPLGQNNKELLISL